MSKDTNCPWCGKELEPQAIGLAGTWLIMVCPDISKKHPRMRYVPRIDYDTCLSPKVEGTEHD